MFMPKLYAIHRLLCLTLALCLATPAHAQEESEFTDNIVIILDASGSMDEPFGNEGPLYPQATTTKMDAAKSAIKTVLETIPETTQIGLLVFSGHGYEDNWIHPLGPRDDRTLLLGIFKPMPAGRTPLGAALKVGADRLLKARTAQHGYGSYRLLVVTDGEATDPEILDQYAPDVVSRGLTLDLIGVGMEQDHSLRGIAHAYRSADDPTALTEAVREIVAEVDFDSSDELGNDIFEVLDGLPDEFAMALLRGLEARANQPIGQSAPDPNAPTPASSSGSASPSGDTGLSSSASEDDGMDGCCFFSVFFLLFVGIVLLKKRNG